MNEEELSRLADLGAGDREPRAQTLEPEVRSGVSFTFGPPPAAEVDWPRFKVVWFFTVKPDKRKDFALNLAAFEPQAPDQDGVTYMGTYSVTISAAAPDLEYRTVWGLETLGALEKLNDLLHKGSASMRAWLDLIAQEPAMRSEIMGRTVGSAKLTGG